MTNPVVGVMMMMIMKAIRKDKQMTNKYFNVDKFKQDEQRKERLMNALVWAVLGFAAIGVMSTFSLVLTKVWEWLA